QLLTPGSEHQATTQIPPPPHPRDFANQRASRTQRQRFQFAAPAPTSLFASPAPSPPTLTSNPRSRSRAPPKHAAAQAALKIVFHAMIDAYSPKCPFANTRDRRYTPQTRNA